ncbi:MAG: tRNA 2-thiouridine(34) synthase MnmA [Clostridia bacterium]|nr:tRNA 2-thiouridine(34) synthase MnmA [Clostridia bacterium]
MKVLLGMSGGVDSSAAAVCLQRAGYECIGATMVMHGECDSDGVSDARAVAQALGMDFHVLDVREEFRRFVMEEFVSSYLRGETPNPCIVCNKTLKFGLFADKATALGAEKIATGHYAVVEKCGDRYLLKKGKDPQKDQSYVLYNLTQKVLSRLILPLGAMDKSEVRELALEASLRNAGKKESQDICFVPDGDYVGFIERYTSKIPPEGDFVLRDGKVMGRHKGIIRYTIGQHKKLGLGIHTPLYVLEKDAENNRIILGSNEELFTRTVVAKDLNWIADSTPSFPFRAAAKIRYRHTEQGATVELIADDTVRVTFDEPQRAATPGQAVVFYDGDIVIGGGTVV